MGPTSGPLAAVLLLLFLPAALVLGQSCYYPDGTLTDVDAPCPDSALCCPLNWQCLSNGLCYDPANDYYERRTCTDRSWQSDECPNFCTYSEGGNEAILWCEDGSYCCDGNRVSFDCCDGTDSLPPGTSYFKLPEGDVVGSITAMGPAPTSSARSSSILEEESTSASDSDSSTPTTTSTRSSETDASTTATSATTDSFSTASSTAPISSVSSASMPAAQDSQESDDQHDSSFGTGAIIGLVIGVAILIALCAIMIWFLHRRHKKSKIPALATYSHAPSSPTEIKYSDALSPGTPVPEIDSSPKAPTDGTSELYGSDTHVRNSTVSSMTAGAQGYSPTSVVSPAVSTGGGNGGAGGRMGQIEEKHEPPPVELWGGHVYRPYRPGLGNQGGQGNGPAYGNAQAYEGT